jgi:hypothetical protein
MGCDIHSRAERKLNGRWEIVPHRAYAFSPEWEPFEERNYRVYAFLAGVRNTFDITPIALPRGLPYDQPLGKGEYLGDHSFSWLLVAELLAFNYDAQVDVGPNSCYPKPDWFTTWRAILGPIFFKDLAKLQSIGAERIVFGFDN